MRKLYLNISLILIGLLVGSSFVKAQGAFNQIYDRDTTLDAAFSVLQTKDGGYILGGVGSDIFAGYTPVWVVKTNCEGDTIWTSTIKISSTGGDQLFSIAELEDSSYVLSGTTQDTILLTADIYLMKLDKEGNQEWITFYGGPINDNTFGNIVITADGGFALSGYTTSFTNGGNDFYLVKTDSLGNLEWQNNYGGVNEEICISMDGTKDGGYILSGRTNSFGLGQFDLYMVKVDSAGNFEWQQTYGTTGSEGGGGAIQTLDGGFVIVGNIDDGAGSSDGYIVKTDSGGNMVWDNSFGYSEYDGFDQVRQLPDGSYIAVGSAEFDASTDQEGWMVKIDQNGNSEWSRLFGNDSVGDYFYDVQLTSDGGFVMCGQYNRIGEPYQNFWLVKTDSLGCDSSLCSLDCITCDFITPSFSSNLDTVYLVDSVPVQFNDNSVISASWWWDFGDGGLQSTEPNPMYMYDSLGAFTVTMVASYGSCADTAYTTVVVLDTTTEIAEFIMNDKINAYPNPTTGQLTLEIDLQKQITFNVKLYHFTGQLIYSEEVGNFIGSYTRQLDLGKYSKGVFYLQLLTDKNLVTRKIIFH